jgi:uncharacterized membrane protein YeaQ/YmgE (transglycosylase-associated protein family)
MPDPVITFAFVIATLIGAVFHFVVGGDARRLAMFLLAGWLGFGIGHLLGNTLDIDLLMIGELRMLSAATGAMFALFVAYILTTDRSGRRPSR